MRERYAEQDAAEQDAAERDHAGSRRERERDGPICEQREPAEQVCEAPDRVDDRRISAARRRRERAALQAADQVRQRVHQQCAGKQVEDQTDLKTACARDRG